MLHRDIKSANIYIDSDGNAKVADFGQSKTLAENKQFGSSSCGTIGFQSPEVIEKGRKQTYAADSWSLGVLFYNLLTGKMPF